jgi:hypothetical protein
MKLSGIKYNNVQESFGMGGPYIGNLEFQGKPINGEFLADGEKLSQDKSKFVFSQYLGFKKAGFLGIKTIQEFRIIIYDEKTTSFYQSQAQYEALAIENMIGDIITFHNAFHTDMERYKRTIRFTDENFYRIEMNSFQMEDFDSNFTNAIVNELEKRISRKLTSIELKAFTLRRSGIAYEMMMDFISDARKTKDEIEEYVESVIEENKK